MEKPEIKLSIELWEEWVLILRWNENQITITRESLVDALADFDDDILAEVKKRKHAKEMEKYNKLQPAGFEYAPESAKAKWEELKNTNNVDKLQWILDNVSYNADHTMNIIKLNKTFCEDVSWIGQRCSWEDAKQLAISKWYKLPTDHNDTDADEIKHDSDWYKMINIFSNGNWETVEGMELFRDMAWCNDRYWTATEHKNDKWEGLESVARYREVNTHLVFSYWSDINNTFRVCGLKDSM